MIKFLKILFLFPVILFSQQEEKKDLPKLEIPEITIVGKKAITLPFAKKGEYNVIDYISATKPDTSILGTKPVLPAAYKTKYLAGDFTENFSGYLEAGLGNYSQTHLLGVVRYSDASWNASVQSGFNSTSGHQKNADGKRFNIGVDFGTMLYTDNEYLRSFRFVNALNFTLDRFGIYGFTDSTVRRSRQIFTFNTQLASSEFKSISFNFLLGLNSFKLTDNDLFETSVFSPVLKFSSSFNIFNINIISKISFETSSLKYSSPVESPTLFQTSILSRTYLEEYLFVSLGFKYIYGSNSDGGYQKFFYPSGTLKYNFNSNLKFSLWFEPDVLNSSYITQMSINPFLNREVVLRYSFKPVNLGFNFEYAYRYMTLSTKFSYAQIDDAFSPFVVNKTIYLVYSDADEIKFEVNSIFEITNNIKLYINGIYNRTEDKKTKQQLIMIPDFQLQSKCEFILDIPVRFWINADFNSQRNVNYLRNLPAYFLLGTGGYTNIFKNTVISLELNNILNTRYDYYFNYSAPGVTFLTKFQYNF